MKLSQSKIYSKSSFFWIPTYYDQKNDIYFCVPENRDFVNKFYQGKYWDDFARKAKKNTFWKYIELILDFFNIPDTGNYKNINLLKKQWHLTKSSKILEIWSGQGNCIKYLSKKWYNIQGVEIDTKNIEHIKNEIWKDIMVEWNYEDIKLDQKYDIIYLKHVLEHFYDLETIITKLKNNLTDKWIIFIDVPDCGKKRILDRSIMKHPHIYHFTKKSLINIFKEQNLECIYLDTYQRLNANISRVQSINSLYRILIRFLHIPIVSKNIDDNNKEPHDLVAIFEKNKSK